MENDCLFCKIIRREIPCTKVYEDEHTFAFLDIHPINRGHTLVIPKAHAQNLYTINSETFTHVMSVVHRLAPKVKAGMNADGINIGINNDAAAGQHVFHLHVHIIPRFNGDGFAHWHGEDYKDGEIEKVREILTRTISP